MKGKKFWITEIILVFFCFWFFFAGLADAFNCDGHVSTKKRDNVLSMLNPVSILLNNCTVLEDAENNLYIGGLAGDDCTIQKFTGEGDYVCSYYINSENRLYEIEDSGALRVAYGEELYRYENDQLIEVTALSRKEIIDNGNTQQKSEGTVSFWTVKLDDGRTIKLEKNASLNLDYSGAFMVTVLLILLIAFTSNEMKRVRDSMGIDEANRKDWERLNEKMKNPDKRNQEWAERNSSKILAKEKYVIKSQKTPEEVKELISSQMDEEPVKLFASVDKLRPFRGKMKGNSFEMVMQDINGGRNSFYPVIKGNIECSEDENVTKVSIVMQMTRYARISNLIWNVICVAIFLIGVASLLGNGGVSGDITIIAAAAGAMVWGLLISRIGFCSGVKKVKKQLDQLFKE